MSDVTQTLESGVETEGFTGGARTCGDRSTFVAKLSRALEDG